MRIGTGKKNHETGGLVFGIAIPFLSPLEIELSKSDTHGQNHPEWIARFEGERCGAFWKKTPKAGGDSFLSGHIESPVFPGGKLEVAIFSAKESERRGEMDMVWSPPRESRADATTSAPSSASAASAPADEDDDIPF